jgi:TonB-dependent starch-binding outer membrane protein SusC
LAGRYTVAGRNHPHRPGAEPLYQILGGGEGSNYSISLNTTDETGIQLASSAKRYNLRANSDFELGKYIKIGESISLTRSISQSPTTYQGNPWQVSLITSPLMRIYNENHKGGFEGPQVPYEYTNPDGKLKL